MRTAAATPLATLLLFATGPTDSAAQDLPDFSGTWTISESSGAPPAGGPPRRVPVGPDNVGAT